MQVGFIGLGNMGMPMARNLMRRVGIKLWVYNRTRSKAEALEKEGAQVAAGPGLLASQCDVVITMLADDRAVEQVVFEENGILESLPRGGCHISMSTISAALSEKLTEAHREAGHEYVAAPVFGRPEAAEKAQIWIVAGGARDVIEKYRNLFQAMGQGPSVVGERPPQANVVKIAGNFMIASAIETLGESFALVRKAGIQPKEFLEVVNQALFKSPLYSNYGGIIADERFEPAGFQLKLGLKDARLTSHAADQFAAPMPLASLIHDRMLAAFAQGQGSMDWASTALESARQAGLRSEPAKGEEAPSQQRRASAS
jgi:3-hydroxyisobutyrate dehydrogenase-like beta-hydroxyacid dehydrogenase